MPKTKQADWKNSEHEAHLCLSLAVLIDSFFHGMTIEGLVGFLRKSYVMLVMVVFLHTHR